MPSSGVNYLAVLVAGVVYFILGAFWYSKALFGNAWMQGIGKTMEQIQAEFSPWKFVGAFIGGLFSSYGIARLLDWTAYSGVGGGAMLGLFAGIVFATATLVTHEVMEGRSAKLILLNSAYNTVGFVLMGVIIGLWQ